MKHKFEAFKCFKHWTILMKNQIGKTMKCLSTNNDLEFYSTKFNEFCKDEDIARQHIVHYTMQQNRVVERMNITLLENSKCMLSNSGLNRSFWVKAINTTCYLVNCSPFIVLGFRTSIEVWSNKTIEYSMLKVFGCPTYYHASEGKLDPKAKKNVFMEYEDGIKGFRIWSLSERKIIMSKDIIFH